MREFTHFTVFYRPEMTALAQLGIGVHIGCIFNNTGRNTCRYFLGNTMDFDSETDQVPLNQMEEIDRVCAAS